MLVAIFSSEQFVQNKISGILSRYMWRIKRGVFIWKDASMINDIKNEFKKIDDQFLFCVKFYVKNPKSTYGIEIAKVGKFDCKISKMELFFEEKLIS